MEEINEVVKSVSAAVPAPAHLRLSKNVIKKSMVPDVWGYIMNFLAIFVRNNVA